MGCWELVQTILDYVKPSDRVLKTGADRRFWIMWSPLIGCWELGQTDDSGLREAPWWGVDNWDRQMILACVKPPDRVLRTGTDRRLWLMWSPLIGCWELGQTDDSGLHEAPWWGVENWGRQTILACMKPPGRVLRTGEDRRFWLTWSPLMGCCELGKTGDSGLREAPWWGVENWGRQMILDYVKPPDRVLRTGADRRFWITWSPLIGCWVLGETDDSVLHEAPW